VPQCPGIRVINRLPHDGRVTGEEWGDDVDELSQAADPHVLGLADQRVEHPSDKQRVEQVVDLFEQMRGNLPLPIVLIVSCTRRSISSNDSQIFRGTWSRPRTTSHTAATFAKSAAHRQVQRQELRVIVSGVAGKAEVAMQ